MILKRFLSLTILAATCAASFSGASAQSLARNTGPAEIPPASFAGNQYVDSKGCVYIRAGVDGNTTWVPRVSRSRKVVCGLSPSLPSGSGTTTVATAPATTAEQPVQIGVANPVAPKSPAATAIASGTAAAATAVRPARTSVADILAPKPVRTVASTPAPQIKRVNIPQPAGVAKPRITRKAPVATTRRVLPQVQQSRTVAAAPQTRQITRQTARVGGAGVCGNATGISRQYIGRTGQPVRCGPQAESPVFVTPNGRVLDPATVSPNARIVPRHVYEQQQASRVVQPVPKGFRQAWSDDRLNPRRAHQTPAGKAQSDMVWTQTVPRRLIITSTGRDVTRSFPQLRYPYTSMAQQQLASTQQQGVSVSSKSTVAPKRVKQTQARVSTRAAAPKKQLAVTGKRYVQVGTFGVASNAQNTAQRLQRMGLPVRIGKFTRGGKELRIVLAGPFKSSAHTGGALTALRNAGYRDAFVRN